MKNNLLKNNINLQYCNNQVILQNKLNNNKIKFDKIINLNKIINFNKILNKMIKLNKKNKIILKSKF